MEYLMTYGWAILVIAVVLGVLFQLGVFSTASFAPKAKAGQCQVQVVGSGSSTTHQLAGLCSPELPQYVATFQTSSYIDVSSLQSKLTGSLTVTGWVYFTDAYGTPCRTFIDNWQGASTYGFESMLYGCAGLYVGNSLGSPSAIGWSTGVVPTDKWVFLAVTYNETTGALQSLVGGDTLSTQSGRPGSLTSPSPIPFYIGAQPGSSSVISFNGYISNIQLYNNSLTSAELNGAYQEGIGGAPVAPQYIVGWWPLNGNFNDYSGNNNNGQSSGVGFTGSWTNGYSAP